MLLSIRNVVGLLSFSAVVAGTSAASYSAGQSSADSARAGIEHTLHKVDALVKSGAHVEQISDALYEDDLMIIGEGEEHLFRGSASFQTRLAYFLKNAPACSLSIVDPIRHSGNLAVAFVHERCKAPDAGSAGTDARVLYVFRNGVKGWRVTMEMFGSGAF